MDGQMGEWVGPSPSPSPMHKQFVLGTLLSLCRPAQPGPFARRTGSPELRNACASNLSSLVNMFTGMLIYFIHVLGYLAAIPAN